MGVELGMIDHFLGAHQRSVTVGAELEVHRGYQHGSQGQKEEVGGLSRKRRRAVPAQAPQSPGQQRRHGRHQENVRDEQGLEQEGRADDPGARR